MHPWEKNCSQKLKIAAVSHQIYHLIDCISFRWDKSWHEVFNMLLIWPGKSVGLLYKIYPLITYFSTWFSQHWLLNIMLIATNMHDWSLHNWQHHLFIFFLWIIALHVIFICSSFIYCCIKRIPQQDWMPWNGYILHIGCPHIFASTHISEHFWYMYIITAQKKARNPLLTTMWATSKKVLLPGHNHLLTTGTDDPSLDRWC